MSFKANSQLNNEKPGGLHLPFALPILQGKKLKKKCCKKFKKGKRCGRCPNG